MIHISILSWIFLASSQLTLSPMHENKWPELCNAWHIQSLIVIQSSKSIMFIPWSSQLAENWSAFLQSRSTIVHPMNGFSWNCYYYIHSNIVITMILVVASSVVFIITQIRVSALLSLDNASLLRILFHKHFLLEILL